MTATQNEIQQLIECCICCDYLTEVRETPCCHQLFCHACIRSWLQTSSHNCPRCRSTILDEQTLTKNVVIQRFVDNLLFDCPYILQGCAAKIPRCDLEGHKHSCTFSPDTLANKRRAKLKELNEILAKYRGKKAKPTDNDFYELAREFHAEQEYGTASECLKMIKDRKSSPDMVVLQARIEQDQNHYDRALQLYQEAFTLAKSIHRQIEILLAKGQLYIKKAQYGEAKQMFQNALDLLASDDQSQTKAEILNAFGLVAKKCSEVRRFFSFLEEIPMFISVQSMNKLLQHTMQHWK